MPDARITTLSPLTEQQLENVKLIVMNNHRKLLTIHFKACRETRHLPTIKHYITGYFCVTERGEAATYQREMWQPNPPIEFPWNAITKITNLDGVLFNR